MNQRLPHLLDDNWLGVLLDHALNKLLLVDRLRDHLLLDQRRGVHGLRCDKLLDLAASVDAKRRRAAVGVAGATK